MTVEVFKPATYCSACAATTRWLDKLGVPFETKELTDEVRDEMFAKGFREAPIVVYQGQAFSGFKPSRLQEIALAYATKEKES